MKKKAAKRKRAPQLAALQVPMPDEWHDRYEDVFPDATKAEATRLAMKPILDGRFVVKRNKAGEVTGYTEVRRPAFDPLPDMKRGPGRPKQGGKDAGTDTKEE